MNKMKTLTKAVAIQSPKVLTISDQGRSMSFGAQQEWYASWIQRMSGCGPTTCSNLFWYLAATRPQYERLCETNGSDKKGMKKLMNIVRDYVKPGIQGVNNTTLFVKGAKKYGQERGIALTADVLNVPAPWTERPDCEQMAAFLRGALKRDLPIAFLNLSKGDVDNLESWHWVTLTAVDEAGRYAEMYDQGRRDMIDMELWLKTTTKGGGLVALS